MGQLQRKIDEINSIETIDAQDVIGAFPSEDGSYPASPEREATVDQISRIVNGKRRHLKSGGARLVSSTEENSKSPQSFRDVRNIFNSALAKTIKPTRISVRQ
ncbi:MAG: hypothetical protein WCK77_24385 [Verrucomicrobiota bacterium]